MRRRHGILELTPALLAWILLVGVYAAAGGWPTSWEGTPAVAFACFAGFSLLYVLQADGRISTSGKGLFSSELVVTALLAVLAGAAYITYGTALGLGRGAIAMRVAVALLPLALHRWRRVRTGGLGGVDLLIVAAIWLPLELGHHARMPLPPAPRLLDLAYLVHLNLALFLFGTTGRAAPMGLGLRLTGAHVQAALGHFLAFMAAAVPLAFAIGFVAWNPTDAGPLTIVSRFLIFFYMVALPEEILFRGVIQNLLDRRYPAHPARVLLGVSLVFGLAHANNPQAPFWWIPIAAGVRIRFAWAYVALATLAGCFYGQVYRRTKMLVAAALIHALVDWIWWACLHKG